MKQAKLLHYQDVGSGDTVVLLHGYLASSKYWQRVIDELRLTKRVIAIDLLGFGNSPKPFLSRYDYEAQMASIETTLDHIGVKHFTLMGHSMGALLSLRFASLHPTRVKKLVLANMPVFLSAREAKRDIMGKNIIYQLGLRRGLHDVIWPLFYVGSRLRLLPVRFAEGTVNRQKFIFQNRGYSRLRSMRNVIFAATIQADLKRLDMKTTIISGISDRQQYLLNLPKLRKARHIVSHVVEGGHHLPLTNPGIFAELATI